MRRRELIAVLGSATALSAPTRAQQQPMPVIGYLSSGSPESDNAFRLTPFRRGLNETGYVEGQNVAIEYRWAQSQYDRLPGLAVDLVGRHGKRLGDDRRGGRQHGSQPLPALAERQGSQVGSIEPEQVEGHIGRRLRVPDKVVELRPSRLVYRDHFAVDYRLVDLEYGRQLVAERL
jgi:hypothetical protein